MLLSDHPAQTTSSARRTLQFSRANPWHSKSAHYPQRILSSSFILISTTASSRKIHPRNSRNALIYNKKALTGHPGLHQGEQGSNPASWFCLVFHHSLQPGIQMSTSLIRHILPLFIIIRWESSVLSSLPDASQSCTLSSLADPWPLS